MRRLLALALCVCGCAARPIVAPKSGPTSTVPEPPPAFLDPQDDAARAAYEALDADLSKNWDEVGNPKRTTNLHIDGERERFESFLSRLRDARDRFPRWASVFLAREASVRETFRRALEASYLGAPPKNVATVLAQLEAKANRVVRDPKSHTVDRELAEALLAQVTAVRKSFGASPKLASLAPDGEILRTYARAWLEGRRAGIVHPRVAAAIGGAALVCLRMTPFECATHLEHAEDEAGATFAAEAKRLGEGLQVASASTEDAIWLRFELGAMSLLQSSSDSTRVERAINHLKIGKKLAATAPWLIVPPIDLLLEGAEHRLASPT